ncbi:MAG: hypothetical protein WDW36_007393 [Sanguina aurantia]
MGYANYTPAKLPPGQLTPQETAVCAVKSSEAIEIIAKLVYNCAVTPKEDKFRRIKLSNPKIQSAVVGAEGAVDALLAMGWAVDETDADFLALPAGVFLSMKEVRVVESAKEKLKKTEEDAAKEKRIAASRASKVGV